MGIDKSEERKYLLSLMERIEDIHKELRDHKMTFDKDDDTQQHYVKSYQYQIDWFWNRLTEIKEQLEKIPKD